MGRTIRKIDRAHELIEEALEHVKEARMYYNEYYEIGSYDEEMNPDDWEDVITGLAVLRNNISYM